METPRILEIQIADDKGAPMKLVPSIKAIEGVGLEGDRYAAGKGAWSGVREVARDISLIESEKILDVNVERNIEITFADTRRNILTIGIQLNNLVGKKFHIGGVLVEGVELCEPCGRPGKLSSNADVGAHFKEAFEGRGGLRVRILATGDIHAEDPITLEE